MLRKVRALVIGLSTSSRAPGQWLLVEIYSKPDQGDISPNEMRRIIGEEE